MIRHRLSELTRKELLRLGYADFAYAHQELIRSGALDQELKCHVKCTVSVPQGGYASRYVVMRPGDFITFTVNDD